MRTAVSTLRLFEPRTLKEAFVMLRDEGPLTPLAGCTDVFVNLNFGTAKETRYLNLWNCSGVTDAGTAAFKAAVPECHIDK